MLNMHQAEEWITIHHSDAKVAKGPDATNT